MLRHKTSELTGPLLDLAVGLAEKKRFITKSEYPQKFGDIRPGCIWLENNVVYHGDGETTTDYYSPRKDAELIVEFIYKYEIALTPDLGGDHWTAWATNPDDESDTRHMGEGETAQIAICRAVVGCVFGEYVELPE